MEILRSTAGIFGISGDKHNLNETERRFYREAFNNFDWSGNGKISYGSLLPAMRRVGVNPTEVEVHDLINKIDDGTGVLTFEDFCSILQEKNKEFDSEQHYKVTFSVNQYIFSELIFRSHFVYLARMMRAAFQQRNLHLCLLITQDR